MSLEEQQVIVVNGISYIQREVLKKSSPKLLSYLVTSSIFMGDNLDQKERKEISMDYMVQEFELIQLKKSKLSANTRKSVEFIFNNRYEEVKA